MALIYIYVPTNGKIFFEFVCTVQAVEPWSIYSIIVFYLSIAMLLKKNKYYRQSIKYFFLWITRPSYGRFYKAWDTMAISNMGVMLQTSTTRNRSVFPGQLKNILKVKVSHTGGLGRTTEGQAMEDMLHIQSIRTLAATNQFHSLLLSCYNSKR